MAVCPLCMTLSSSKQRPHGVLAIYSRRLGPQQSKGIVGRIVLQDQREGGLAESEVRALSTFLDVFVLDGIVVILFEQGNQCGLVFRIDRKTFWEQVARTEFHSFKPFTDARRTTTGCVPLHYDLDGAVSRKVVVNAKRPVRLTKHFDDFIAHVVPKTRELSLPDTALFADEARAASGEVVYQVDERESLLFVARDALQFLQKFLPLVFVDARRCHDLFVTYDARIFVPENIDSGTVAQLDEQRFSKERPERFRCGRIGPDTILRDSKRVGHFANKTRTNGIGIKEFDQMVHLARADKNQLFADKPVRGLPISSLELLEPSRKAFDETLSREEILISIIFHSGHQAQPRKLMAGSFGIPVHEIGQFPENELLIQGVLPERVLRRNRTPPRINRSAFKYSRAAWGPRVPGVAKFQHVDGSAETSSTLNEYV